MKRLSLIVIILLLSALAIAGCAKPAPVPITPTPTTAAPTTKSAPTPAASVAPSPAQSSAPAPKPTAPSPKYGGTFKFIDPRGPTTSIGWFAETGSLATMFAAPMFESLLRCDYNANLSPLLATAWEIAPDLKSITLTLRKGVKFHDGSDFNAAIAKWIYDEYINAKLSSVVSWKSVDVIDDYTIRINLKTYDNTILNTLASILMVSKQSFESKGKEGIRWNPVGTGPFQYASFERDVSIKFTRFNDYWQKGKPYLNAVEEYFIVDPMTKSAAFLAGSADATGGDLGKQEYDLMQKGYPVVKAAGGVVCLVGDSKNSDSPFSNIKVRQAIDYAIDRDAIVKARGFGFSEPVYQFAIPNTPSYIKDLPARTYNPEKAKQLLTEAGFPGGFKTKLISDQGSTDREAMVIIQGFLSKVGINAELNAVDQATYTKFRTSGWNNAMLAGTLGTSANMNSMLGTNWSQTSRLFPSLARPDEIQKLYLDSLSAKNYDIVLVQKIIRFMFDNAMFNPLYTTSRGHVLQPYVHDTGFYTLDSWPRWTPSETWLDK